MQPPTNWVITMNSSSPAPAATSFDPLDKTQVQAFAKGEASARHAPPTVIEASDGKLNPLLGATVSISNLNAGPNDTVVVNWEGENESTQWSSLPTKVGNNNPLDIAVPAYIVIASAEMFVRITYIVVKDGVPSLSPPLTLKVEPIASQGPSLIHDDFEDALLGTFTELKRPGMTIKASGGTLEIINRGNIENIRGDITGKAILSSSSKVSLEITFDTETIFFAFSVAILSGNNNDVFYTTYTNNDTEIHKRNVGPTRQVNCWVTSDQNNKIKKIQLKPSYFNHDVYTRFLLDNFWLR
ncbi:hypothetical protein GPJ81_14505 [Pseudomonas alkylphenolica]|uniref:Uncharacterized protein n=1 Tax=Pseudomonas alkylphenolica TaxID=237609 RepID=A0A6I6H8U9_9PSED|nr:hypothetical protein [Pseudomonas alkylphenolica]QGW77844.1 hypothetical protein GPJ81_14505 [Pseudomonas alkylphenolica]